MCVFIFVQDFHLVIKKESCSSGSFRLSSSTDSANQHMLTWKNEGSYKIYDIFGFLIYDLFEDGDDIMADKGFLIIDLNCIRFTAPS